MTNSHFIPRFENDIKEFACDLRLHVFSSQAAASRHFHVHPSTISRYEKETKGGRMLPPAGYLAELARLTIERKTGGEDDVGELQQGLLKEINKAIRSAYPEQRVLADWRALTAMADGFMGRNQPAAEQPSPLLQDWGDAPAQEVFFGREKTLARLRHYLIEDPHRIVGLWGAGGIG